MSAASAVTRSASRRLWQRWLLPVAAAGAAGGVLVGGLVFGHGLNPTTITGLPDPGRFTDWALPAVRVGLDAAAAATVGLCVAAAFLLPGDGRTVSPQGFRLLGLAGWGAAGWAMASLALLVLTTADLLGSPVSRLSGTAVLSFATSVSQGQALLLQAVLALLVAVLCRTGVSRATAASAAVVAMVAVLPPAFTGHAAGAGNHQIAVTSLALHVLAASVWTGGLLALLVLRGDTALLAGMTGRYSRAALACWVVVAVSGTANAWVRLGAWGQLWQSRYGLLVLGKVVAVLLLGGIGAMHRARTLPAVRAGSRRALRRLAAGEIVVFAATFGLAVALSRSPTPVPTTVVDTDPVTDLLGFSVPARPTVGRMLEDVLPDMFFLTATTIGVGAYLAGVWRLRRAGHRWPVGRTASWVSGMLLLAAMTNLGVARYAYVLFSVHMVQHMVLSMVVPVLLVAGAPATLALRALRQPADPQVRGAREWLLIALHSRVLKLLTHPVVALAIYAGTLYVLYFSDLLGLVMRYHVGHMAMLVHFVVAGYLLFWVLIGVDPGRRRIAPPLLVLVLFAAMGVHAFFGVILMQSNTLVAPVWYTSVHPAWAGSLLADQHLGAGIAWAFGEIPAAIVMVILIRRWIQTDQREQARLDRAADRAQATGEDELARYNAFLREAAKHVHR